MQKLSGEALRVLAHAAKGGHGRQRWTIGVPADKGSGGEPGEGGLKKARKAITLGKSKSVATPSLLNVHARTG